MNKILFSGSILAIVALIFGPVVVTKLSPEEPREYRRVQLAELEYTEISFRNELQRLDLAGMLFLPEGAGPFPAAVIIHGSGTSIRDNNWYLTLASYLQKNGVVVLLPDKRGSEKSQGDWRTSSFEDLATDTLAAIDFLKSQEVVDISHIGLIGMSQGGWIAPIVATRSPDLDFVISMVGASVTTHEQLLYEENFNLREMGFLPGISNLFSLASTFILENITLKGFYAAVGTDFDPLDYWRKVNVPTLTLYGEEDTNVPSSESKARIESLGKDNIQVIVYQGSGHALQDPPGAGNDIIREEALLDMLNFINAVKNEPISLNVPAHLCIDHLEET